MGISLLSELLNEKVNDKERAGLYVAGPLVDTTAPGRVRGFKGELLDRIREAAPRDLCANGIPDLLLVQMFCSLAHV